MDNKKTTAATCLIEQHAKHFRTFAATAAEPQEQDVLARTKCSRRCAEVNFSLLIFMFSFHFIFIFFIYCFYVSVAGIHHCAA